jgi:hypothetical protein
MTNIFEHNVLNTKIVEFNLNEVIKKNEQTIENGIFNGFGNILFKLPSTQEIKLDPKSFNPVELGQLFIEFGQSLQKETHNIENLELTSRLQPRQDYLGYKFTVQFVYDTCKELNKE